jgi:uronate dehydrogenase
MPQILLTGAAGRLGTHFRLRLAQAGRAVLATDIAAPDDGGEVVLADLADRAAVDALMQQDISAVVHLGGMSKEAPWQQILDANISGTYNIFDAARKAGVSRVVYASSYHVLGMYPATEVPLDIHAEARPDTLYAVSKLFGENLGRLYHDKFGIGCMSIRICAANPPNTTRDLKLYVDRDDLVSLVTTALDAPELGYRTVFAISDNDDAWYVNEPAQTLGWQPQHSSRDLPLPAGKSEWPAPDPAVARLQGAAFANWGHFDD